MPSLSAAGTTPQRAELFALAAAQGGYFTQKQAQALGYSPQLVRYYVQDGLFERAARGILRLTHFPPADREDLTLASLWSDGEGVFSHETALELHGLSDALPSHITMTLPRAWRGRRLRTPERLELRYAELPDADITWYGALHVTTPQRTLYDCVVDHVSDELIEQARTQGIASGLFTRGEARSILHRAKRERDGKP